MTKLTMEEKQQLIRIGCPVRRLLSSPLPVRAVSAKEPCAPR